MRVVQGLAQAIGFIAAGAIFVARGDVHNLTSAANLWLAAAIGIAAGAGQYVLFGAALILGIVLITVVRLAERLLPGNSKSESKTIPDTMATPMNKDGTDKAPVQKSADAQATNTANIRKKRR